MEKKTYDFCIEVLKRYHKAGLLKHVIIVGSWCIYFYRDYFRGKSYITSIRTSDIDFLVPIPVMHTKNDDLFALVEDLGYIRTFSGDKGYIRFSHPELTIEFLVPEKGRASDKPYPIPQLGINAQPLRYLHFLQDNAISLVFEGMNIRVPHPAAYALHKFIIFKRRTKPDKQNRDIEGALRVFRQLQLEGKNASIESVFRKMHRKWQTTVIGNLKSVGEDEIAAMLEEIRISNH
ncbi:MAG: GSU2403 family nucleotidyltransferase fold protein [Victivallales bacterium]